MFVFEAERNRIRRSGDLRLEQLMDQDILRIRQCRVVEAGQYLAALHGRQNVKCGQRLLRTVPQRLDQRFDGLTDIGCDPGWVHAPGALRLERKSPPQVVHGDHERVVGALLAIEDAYAFSNGDAARFRFAVAVPVVEYRAKQRCSCRHGTAALREGQRGLFMRQQVDDLALHIGCRFGHATAGEFDPHGQRVDEHAQHLGIVVGTLQAARQHGSEHDVVPAAADRQNLRPGEME